MRSLISVVAVAGLATIAQAQVGYSGGTYLQDFDTLPNSGALTWVNDTTLPGWFAYGSGIAGVMGSRDTGTLVNPVFTAGTGTSTAGGLHSWGASQSTERALGSIGSGGVSAGDIVFALILQNTSGQVLDSFTLGYNTEQWRNGGVAAVHTQVLDYAIFASAPVAADLGAANTAGYTAPGGLWDAVGPVATTTAGAVDGNTAGLVTGRGGVASVTWNPGEFLVIRWWDDNDVGNDHGIGIDDVTFSAVPAPGAALLLGLGLVAAGRRRR